MEQHQLGYGGGINKDLAKDKYNNQSYFHAKNVKVVTSEGLSSGNIHNEDGNKLLFKFPTVRGRTSITLDDYPSHTGTFDINATTIDTAGKTYQDLVAELNATFSAEVAANQIYFHTDGSALFLTPLISSITITNPTGDVNFNAYTLQSSVNYICGWTRLNEWIIVFTSESNAEDPTGAVCRIWKFKFSDTDNTVIEGINPTTFELDPTQHLIYNDRLEYSTYKHITDTEVRFENDSIGRVVFTDYHNNLRFINIFSEDNFSLKPSDLDISPDVIFSRPNIISIQDGGSLNAGSTIQYFYRLLNSEGGLTDISPGSHLMQLEVDASNINSINSDDLTYAVPNTSNTKSVTIEINDIDLRFQVIQVFAVIRPFENTPTIVQFAERNIPDTGTLQITHTGSEENVIEFSQEEFNKLSTSFICKTVTSVDNRLVAANLKEPSFEIDFDARSYRFAPSTNSLLLLDKSSGTVDTFNIAALTDFNNIPEDHDAICLANNPDFIYAPENLNAAPKHLYQRNSTTIGGSGRWVNYQFTNLPLSGSSNSSRVVVPDEADEGYNRVVGRLSPDQTTSWGEVSKDGNSIQFNVNNEINSFHSAKISAYFKGHARGEVYRYGIVFYNKKGQSSFVKWIGDIKFPEPKNGFLIGDATNKKGLDPNTVNTLGINFEIDVQSIVDQITGFKIVRVERKQQDKTRLGTGAWWMFDSKSNAVGGAPIVTDPTHAAVVNRYFKSRNNAGNRELLDDRIDIFGSSYGTSARLLHLGDTPQFSPFITGSTAYDLPARPFLKRFGVFQSPLIDYRQFNNYSFNSNHYLRDLGYYSCDDIAYNDDMRNGEINNTDAADWGSDGQLGFIYKARKWYAGNLSTSLNYEMITPPLSMRIGEPYISGLDSRLDDYLKSGSGAYADGVEVVTNTLYARQTSNYSPVGIGAPNNLFILKAEWTWTAFTGPDTLNNAPTSGIEDSFLSYAEDLDLYSPDEENGGKNWGGVNIEGSAQSTWYLKEFAYCAKLTGQYGGDTYEERSKSTYVDTGHYQIIAPNMGGYYNFSVWGGDTYVHNFDKEIVVQHWTGIFPAELAVAYDNEGTNQTRVSVGLICPCETDYPFFLDSGYRWARDRRGSIADAGGTGKNDFTIFDNRTEAPSKYFQENNIRTNLIALDFLLNQNNVFKNRFRVSEEKFDGELEDSWRKFLSLNFKDIEGKYGEIHKIIFANNGLYYFQDRAHGIQPINERSLIQDSSQTSLVLGTGSLLGDHVYISTLSGTSHQQSVIATPNGIYYYDSSHKSINFIQGQELSKLKGLISYFPNVIKDNLLIEDFPHVSDKGSVVGVYDIRHNRILYTFRNSMNTPIINQFSFDETGYYNVGDKVLVYDSILERYTTYECLIQGDYLSNIIPSSSFWEVKPNESVNSFTLSYNELLGAFESFYDYTPNRYLNVNNQVLSINPANDSEGWVHTVKATKSNFFNNLFDSEIILLVNPTGKLISIMDNIEYLSEVSLDSKDIVSETISNIHVWNEYQNTGKITFSVPNNIRRYFRTWRTNIPRDVLSGVNKARIRHYYIYLKLTYNNSDNKKIVLSDIFIKHRPTRI